MVVSRTRETPISTPKYYNPYYWDPNKVSLLLGNPHIILTQEFYLHEVVFPAVLRHADAKLSANGQDLGGEA